MPSSSSSSLALPVRLIEPLAERGSDVPLATLAAGFRNAAKSYLPAESWFEVSVRIWHTLRQLADSMPAPAAAEPDDAETTKADIARLCTLTSALEYFLFDLNKQYEVNGQARQLGLRLNPFLTHWVQAAEECVATAKKLKMIPARSRSHPAILLRKKVCDVRSIILEAILSDDVEVLEELGDCSPQELAEQENSLATVDLDPYHEMLYETGVWDTPDDISDDSQSSDGTDPTASGVPNPGDEEIASGHTAPASLTQKDIETAFRSDPTATFQYLTHFGVDLKNLELLNGVLASPVLEDLGIGAIDLARDFIQHGLRDIESMAETSPNSETTSGSRRSNNPSALAGIGTEYASSPPLEFLLRGGGTASSGTTTGSDQRAAPKGDREAQARAVKLLVLFMKNLIKRGIASAEPAGLLYEVEEVCVRYMFLPEVRDFRRWLEGGEGVGEELPPAPKMGG